MQDLTQFLNGDLGERLRFDLVAHIKSLPQMLADYGITTAELTHLLRNDVFQRQLAEMRAVWSSTANIAERIKARALAQVEASQLELTRIAHGESGASLRIDAIQTMMGLAGLTQKQAQAPMVVGNPGDRFQIQFVFTNAPPVEITGHVPATPLIEGSHEPA